jgi:glycosyltransferase involved in cell wall biosynthesis
LTGSSGVRVALCTITYRRPVGLAWCLDAIARLTVAADVELRVVVVDNDVDESARSVVDGRTVAGVPVEYVVEPERGIAHARNRALACVAAGVDAIAFIDDDEAPDPGWLDAVLDVWRSTGADVVIGPSVPQFADGTPSWMIDGGFFDRKRFATGTPISPMFARTSGVLVDARRLPSPPVFDVRFPLTGGSDTELFHRLVAGGARMVWCDEAIVHERVPPSRARVRWLVMRQFRTGNARSLRLLPPGRRGVVRRARRIGRGVLDAVTGVAALLAAAGKGRAAGVRALQRIAYAIGLVTGALGVPYREYRVVHGD